MSQARSSRARSPRLAAGALASLALHGLIVASLARPPSPHAPRARPAPVEVAFVPRPTPPPDEPSPELIEPVVAPAPPPPRRPPRPALARPPAPAPPGPPPTPDPEPPALDEAPPPALGLPAPGPGEGLPVAQGDGLSFAPASAPTGPARAAPAADGVPGGTGSAGSQAADSSGGFAPVPASAVRRMPGILREVQAPYPERARLLEIEGTVLLSVGVDEHGRTREVRLLRGIGHGLDEAAMQALREFRWSPAIGHDGRPVAIRLTYSYRFRVPR